MIAVILRRQSRLDSVTDLMWNERGQGIKIRLAVFTAWLSAVLWNTQEELGVGGGVLEEGTFTPRPEVE